MVAVLNATLIMCDARLAMALDWLKKLEEEEGGGGGGGGAGRGGEKKERK